MYEGSNIIWVKFDLLDCNEIHGYCKGLSSDTFHTVYIITPCVPEYQYRQVRNILRQFIKR